MKNTAFAATATLAAALLGSGSGLAADKISLGLGGSYTQYFGYADNDTNTGDFQGFDTKADGEIGFAGETALDSGLQFGLEVTLKTESAGSDQIDGSFLYAEHAAGRLEMGSRDNAAALMHYSAPDVGLGINDSDIADWVVNLSGGDADSAFQSTFLFLGEDKATKISYFSPRIEGFQIGASYIPEFERDNNAQPQDDLYNNGLALGANFVRTFGETEIALAVGYLVADRPDGAGSTGEDAEGFSFGGNLTYAGFTVGGSFADTQGSPDGGTTTATSFDGRGFDLGVAYAFGDASVSLSYYQGEIEDSVAVSGDSKHNTVMLSGAYEMGPGVTVLGSLFRSEFEADTGADNDGWALVSGVRLEF